MEPTVPQSLQNEATDDMYFGAIHTILQIFTLIFRINKDIKILAMKY